jgi:hypothetical protein
MTHLIAFAAGVAIGVLLTEARWRRRIRLGLDADAALLGLDRDDDEPIAPADPRLNWTALADGWYGASKRIDA